MATRIGPIEEQLRAAVQAYISRHPYGAQSRLGELINRSSAWVGGFANGRRRASIDEAVTLAAVLDIDLVALLRDEDIAALQVQPLDRREKLLLRLFVRIPSNASRNAVITVMRTLIAADEEASRRVRQQKRAG